MAGNANTKFTAPKPKEANSVCVDEKLASAKISDYKREAVVSFLLYQRKRQCTE